MFGSEHAQRAFNAPVEMCSLAATESPTPYFMARRRRLNILPKF